MKKLISYSVLIILLTNCKPYKEKKEKITLPDEKNIKELVNVKCSAKYILEPCKAINCKLSYSPISNMPYISETKYIPLDSKNGIIGRISKILFYKNRIFILDKPYSGKYEAIFVYDTLGNSIRKIDQQGKGPKEFLGLDDIDIDTTNKLLVVRDRLSPKIHFYDFNGNYVFNKTTKLQYNNYAIINDKMICNSIYFQNYHTASLKNYSLFTCKNDTIKFRGFRFKPFEMSLKHVHYNYTLFRNFKGYLLFMKSGSDTVYRILSDSSYCAYAYINFKKPLSKELQKIKRPEDYDPTLERKYMKLWDATFLETDNAIFYDCVYTLKEKILENGRSQIIHYIYNKNKKISYVFYDKADYDIGLTTIFSWPIGVYKNYFVGIFYEIYEFKEFVEKFNNKIITVNDSTTFKMKIKDKNLMRIIENVNKNSNPVILLYRFEFSD